MKQLFTAGGLVGLVMRPWWGAEYGTDTVINAACDAPAMARSVSEQAEPCRARAPGIRLTKRDLRMRHVLCLEVGRPKQRGDRNSRLAGNHSKPHSRWQQTPYRL